MVNGFQGTKSSVFWILESSVNPVVFLFKFSADPSSAFLSLGRSSRGGVTSAYPKLID